MDDAELLARRLNTSVEAIFRRAIDTHKPSFSNAEQTFKFRYARWLRCGELPHYVEKFIVQENSDLIGQKIPVQ